MGRNWLGRQLDATVRGFLITSERDNEPVLPQGVCVAAALSCDSVCPRSHPLLGGGKGCFLPLFQVEHLWGAFPSM